MEENKLFPTPEQPEEEQNITEPEVNQDAVSEIPEETVEDTVEEATEETAEEVAAEPEEGQPTEPFEATEPQRTVPPYDTGYTVQNPNPYFNYYSSGTSAPNYVNPVPVKKKKEPLMIGLIVVSVLLVLTLVGSMAVIMYLANRSSVNYEEGPTISDVTGGENAELVISQQNKADSEEQSVKEVAKKLVNQVVGIVSTSGEGFYANESQGSGVIFSADGYIVTNAHVIKGATGVKVVMPDEEHTSYDAKIIGSDTKTDLAVLKIDATDLDAVDIGASAELEVGETVIAVGNPYGLDLASSVTRGIISALNREVTTESANMTLIQTDAAINPGNSGGALVNLYGQVIGINSSKISDTDAEGLGFAIPIDDVVPIVQELISRGYISGRPMIGIQGQDVSMQMSMMYNLPTGVYVAYVDEAGSAYKAGLRQYDIITEFNNEKVTCYTDLDSAKDKCKAGDTVPLEFYRYSDGKYYTINVTLSESNGN